MGRGVRRYFYVLGRYVWAVLVPAPPGENDGWGNRFRLEAHVHPEGYCAGFNNPSIGIQVELVGWKLSLGIEY